MIPVKLSDQSFNIPTGWHEVKYLDFANAQGQTLEIRLSCQTTIPKEIISTLTLPTIKKLIDIVEFQETLPEFYEAVKVLNKKGEPLIIGDEPYIKMEQARQALEQKSEWLAAIDIVKLYLDKDISQMTVKDSIGYAVFFLEQLKVSLKGTKH